MADSNQIRINELARELEVKAKVLIEFLPEIGVTEKKTHSSSLALEHAELARKHFAGLQAKEAAAEAEKQAKATAAKKPAARPTVTAAPTPSVAKPASAAPASAASPAARPAAPSAIPGTPATRPAAAPSAPAAASSATSAHPSSHPPTAPSQAPAAAKPGVAPATAAPAAPARPGVAPSAARPGVPLRPAAPGQPGAPASQRPAAAAPAGSPATASGTGSGTSSGTTRPAGGPPSQGQRFPTRPGAPPSGGQPRPGAPQSFRPAAAPGQRPSGPRPGMPLRPGGGPPGRYPQRPGGPGERGGRPNQGPVGGQRPGATGGAGIPKAEPGKPLYARKPPASRGRPLIEKRYAEGERKLHPVRTRAGAGAGRTAQAEPVAPVQREPREVTVTEGITVRELAEKLDIRAKELLKTLLDRGVFASINQALDAPTATSLAEAFNGIVQVVSFEEQIVQEEKVKEVRSGNQQPRAPVVTVMGHVDHGKTSLLDAIRETEVAAGEAGGITQHIGAYEARIDGRRIVFIDTPGHEAFTRMRSRGAKVTDIVVLVVSADDGVRPQTQEAVDHAKDADVPMLVAVNKIDKEGADPTRVRTEMTALGLQPVEWGGDVEFVNVSAKTREGLDDLLETIIVMAEVEELKANPDAPASGTVIESKLDAGRGPGGTILIMRGPPEGG